MDIVCKETQDKFIYDFVRRVKALQIAAKFKIQAFVTTTRKSIHVDQCAQIHNLFIPVPITNLTVLLIQVQIYPFVFFLLKWMEAMFISSATEK